MPILETIGIVISYGIGFAIIAVVAVSISPFFTFIALITQHFIVGNRSKSYVVSIPSHQTLQR